MRTKIIIALLLCLVMAWFSGCGEQQGNASEDEERIPVEVATVELGNVIQSIEYNGDIKAEYEVKVFSKVPDRIEQFFKDEGDFVKKGEPIAKIIATTIEQAARQTEAALVAAKAQEANLRIEYERAERLNRENAMSKQQYDGIKTQFEAVKAQVEQAEAAVKSAKSLLGDATIKAPISGIIGTRYYEAGDMANPAMPLVTIVQMDRVKITFNATEEDLGKLQTGQAAKVFVKSYTNQVFEGKITKISPVLDPLTRMAKVEVIIKNPDKKLKPGMYARIEVVTGVIKNTIVVPRHTTIESTTLEKVNGKETVIKNYYVFVADSSKAKQRKLDVLYVNHVNIAVISGLEIGEKLITLGQNYLRDGLPISIVNEEDEAK